MKAYNPDDEDHTLERYDSVASDSTSDDPNDPPRDAMIHDGTVQRIGEDDQQQPAPSKPAPEVKPYEPPKTNATPEDAPPSRTFAQIEAEGQARPPQPTATDAVQGMLGGSDVPPIDMPAPVQPYSVGPATDAGGSGMRDTPTLLPYAAQATDAGQQQPDAPITSGIPPMVPEPAAPIAPYTPPTVREYGDAPTLSAADGPVAPRATSAPIAVPALTPPPSTSVTATQATPVADAPAPSSTDAVLQMLLGGISGDNKSELAKATDAKTLAQLNGSSPYDSKAVRDEYDYLAGNIDDQYAGDVRSTDDAFARRGLYGSSGKDFHSGRLSDLNVGKRSAKIALGQDLANKYATTKGQYDANAITQGQAGTQQDTGNKLDWLRAYMGYGDDAFNHDLATAQFQQGQNESEQDYILRMLQAGYGV